LQLDDLTGVAGDAGDSLCSRSAQAIMKNGLRRLPFLTINNNVDPVTNGVVGLGFKRLDGPAAEDLLGVEGRVWDSLEFASTSASRGSAVGDLVGELTGAVAGPHKAALERECGCWAPLNKMLGARLFDNTRPIDVSYAGSWDRDDSSRRVLGTFTATLDDGASVTFDPLRRPTKVVWITSAASASITAQVSICGEEAEPHVLDSSPAPKDFRVEVAFDIPADCPDAELVISYDKGFFPDFGLQVDAFEAWYD
jgi:hypothetical protein